MIGKRARAMLGRALRAGSINFNPTSLMDEAGNG